MVADNTHEWHRLENKLIMNQIKILFKRWSNRKLCNFYPKITVYNFIRLSITNKIHLKENVFKNHLFL